MADPDPSINGGGTIIDSLGTEIIGVISPVSICMLLVVLLISALSPPPSSSPQVTAATLVYLESASDPPSQKLVGALLNAAAFIALVTIATFLIVLLYYYNFTSFLKNYMRFSAFLVLASMGGSIAVSLLRRFSIPLDAVTSLLLLLNFSAVGVLSVFSPAVPILLRQAYMVVLGVIVAAWFTNLPEWTTWTLLLALAVYDLVAVLTPKGPLKLLVDLASSRDEELPALVYEARPTISRSSNPPVVAAPLFTASIELQPLPDTPTTEESVADHAIVEIEHVDGGRMRESVSGQHSSEIEILETSPLVVNEDVGRRTNGAQGGHALGLEMFDTMRGIRLGLGDFVFYSVLVGRAAMYDLMTVYACYLAIICGLGCTLILLSVCRHALPALPISITLGVGFYFLTRLLLEPFVIGASSKLVMF
ncbi:putative presenilin/signal peptide peptidase [Dioscorea sansibarensis]